MKSSISSLLAATVLSLTVVPSWVAAQSADKKGDMPKESPGWVVVEEDIWYPFLYDAEDAFQQARFHYRRREERASAAEIRKAVTWLKLASGHALPESKKALNEAASDLEKLAADLDGGAVVAARRLDDAFAKANHALSVFHYFKAKSNMSRKEERLAAQDLEAAARYLRAAASSARYEYGSETVTFFDEVDDLGYVVARGESIEPNRLAANLSALDREILKLAATLEKTVK